MKSNIHILTNSFFNSLDIDGRKRIENFSVFKFPFSKQSLDLIPILKKAYRADYYLSAKVLSGSLTVRIDFKIYKYEKDHCFFITPNNITQLIDFTSDCILEGLTFKSDFIREGKLPENLVTHMDFFSYRYDRVLRLNSNDSRQYSKTICKMCERVSTFKEKVYGMELLVNSFSEFVLEIAGIYKEHRASLGFLINHKEELVYSFVTLARQFHLSERNLSFYSKKLAITTKHLSETTKETIGKTAGEIIDELNLLEAKRLLEYTDLSIAEISDQLKFSSPAFFSKFFSRQAGHSPKAYRLGLN